MVRSRCHFEFAIFVYHKPCPTRAEACCCCSGETFNKSIIAAEFSIDSLFQRAFQLRHIWFCHDIPEHSVVLVTATVVDNCLTDIFWHISDIAEDTVYTAISKIRIFCDSSVQIINIRLMVLIMVQFHCFCVDNRLKIIISIWQWCEFERFHNSPP